MSLRWAKRSSIGSTEFQVAACLELKQNSIYVPETQYNRDERIFTKPRMGSRVSYWNSLAGMRDHFAYVMLKFELSPDPDCYTNIKYWKVAQTTGRLLLKPAIPWKWIVLVEAVVSAVAYGIFRFADRLVRHSRHPEDRYVLYLMCIPLTLAVVGCLVIPVRRALVERAKGDILTYDPDVGILKLPRARLSLKKSQIIEFRILQEIAATQRRSDSSDIPEQQAELQLVYRNPNERMATLLRADRWRLFEDVIKALKAANVAKIVLAEKHPESKEWTVREG